MAADTSTTRQSGLIRNLSVWQAVGLSVALMAPSMAANINPQATADKTGRAVPLAFLLAAIGVLFVGYGFVRLCQYYQHAGSVYAFNGLTLGPRTGAVSGLALFATYTFYGVVTSSAFGYLGSAFLDEVGVWNNPPTWVAFALAGIALAGCLLLTIIPARRGTTTVLIIEGATVTLIVVVAIIILVHLIRGNVPEGGNQKFTLDVFTVAPGTPISLVFLGIVFGFLSFAGFEAASTLGEETSNPRRDIPRAILGTAIFGGIYFVVVTAIEVMAFGTGKADIKRFVASGSLMGDLATSYIAAWVGDVITLGATISAFACCLACMVGASRLLFAMNRDVVGAEHGLSKVSRYGTPGVSAFGVLLLMLLIHVIMGITGRANIFATTFTWSATIGTLILLVVYVITTVGAISLVFVRQRMQVPKWQIIIPVLAIVVLGYTIYRNVLPWPTTLSLRALPITAGAWIVLCVLAVLLLPNVARQLGRQLAADEGFATERETVPPKRLADV